MIFLLRGRAAETHAPHHPRLDPDTVREPERRQNLGRNLDRPPGHNPNGRAYREYPPSPSHSTLTAGVKHASRNASCSLLARDPLLKVRLNVVPDDRPERDDGVVVDQTIEPVVAHNVLQGLVQALPEAVVRRVVLGLGSRTGCCRRTGSAVTAYTSAALLIGLEISYVGGT